MLTTANSKSPCKNTCNSKIQSIESNEKPINTILLDKQVRIQLKDMGVKYKKQSEGKIINTMLLDKQVRIQLKDIGVKYKKQSEGKLINTMLLDKQARIQLKDMGVKFKKQSEAKLINTMLLDKQVRILLKDIGVEYKKQSVGTTNRSLVKEDDNVCESSVETYSTEVSSEVETETNKQKENEALDSDSIDMFDEDVVSEKGICCGNNFCGCSSCKTFRVSPIPHNKSPCKNIRNLIKQSIESNKKLKNTTVSSKQVRILLKDIGIEYKKQSEGTNNRSLLKEQHNVCESYVEKLATEVSSEINTESNKECEDETLDSGSSDMIDEDKFSENSICCGNIFCDCIRCKAFRVTQITHDKSPCKNIHNSIKQSIESSESLVNAILSGKQVRILLKDIGIDYKKQSERTSNRSLVKKEEEHNICESFVETMSTEVASELETETNKEREDEALDSNSIDMSDEDEVSERSICCSNIAVGTLASDVSSELKTETKDEREDEALDDNSIVMSDVDEISERSFCSSNITVGSLASDVSSEFKTETNDKREYEDLDNDSNFMSDEDEFSEKRFDFVDITVGTLTSEVLCEVQTETKKEREDEVLDCDSYGMFDGYEVSEKSVCCGNISCGCSRCKVFKVSSITDNMSPYKSMHNSIQQNIESDEDPINTVLLHKKVRTLLKKTEDIGIEEKKQSRGTSNESLVREDDNICESSVEILGTEVSVFLETETNQKGEDEALDSDSSDIFGEEDVSEKSTSGNITVGTLATEGSSEAQTETNKKGEDEALDSDSSDIFDEGSVYKDSLQLHLKNKCNTLKLYSCEFCAKEFSSRADLKYHVSKIHLKTESIKLSCELCGKLFDSRTGLIKHKTIGQCSGLPQNNRHERNSHGLGRPQKKLTYSCEICEKQYKRKDSLTRHILITHENKRFECGHCSKVYHSKDTLSSHVHRMHMQIGSKCDVPDCKKTFASSLDLRNHMLSAHSSLASETCGKCFAVKTNLQEHMLIHTGKTRVCGNTAVETLTTEASSEVQTDTNKKIENEALDSGLSNICGEEENSEKSTSVNITVGTLATEVPSEVQTQTNKEIKDEGLDSDSSDMFHADKASEKGVCRGNIFCDCSSCCKAFGETKNTSKLKLGRKYSCGLCNKSFRQKKSLQWHVETKCNTLKLHSCEFCTKAFSRGYLKYHLSTVHLKTETIKLKCELCGKVLFSKNGFIRHKRISHGLGLLQKKLTYSCDICKKVYPSKKSLTRHAVIHGDETFECGHCSKVYQNKINLSNHIQSRHMQIRFKCDKPNCNRKFVSSVGLRNHELSVHTKASFMCETCGKCFALSVGLQTHMSIHTGEKLFICQVCGKNFRTESNLHQHSRTHSDKRPFSCELCPKAFRIRHHLRQHMSVHGMVQTSVRRKQPRS